MALGLAKQAMRGEMESGDFRGVLPPEIRSRPFGLFLDRSGRELLFGKPLTEPYLAPDEAIEQVYENAVLYSPKEDPSTVLLRPLGRLEGPPDPPVGRAAEADSLYFAQTGHNVRWAFAAFYRTRGGPDMFGLPLEEAGLLEGVLSQRFEKVILQYRFDLPAHLAVQLAPVGREYLNGRTDVASPPTQYPATETPAPTPALPSTNALVTTQIDYPVLPAGTPQRVNIRVELPEGAPWTGVVPVMAIQGPRSTLYVEAPATDHEGRSQVTIVMDDLRPGEIVNYEVAVAAEQRIAYTIGQFAGGFGEP